MAKPQHPDASRLGAGGRPLRDAEPHHPRHPHHRQDRRGRVRETARRLARLSEMRLVTFTSGARETFGALVDDEHVIDLSVGFAWYETDRGRPLDAAAVRQAYGADMLE